MSYTLFQPNKNKFVYKGEITGQAITCNLNLLKMAMMVVKPHLFVDHLGK